MSPFQPAADTAALRGRRAGTRRGSPLRLLALALLAAAAVIALLMLFQQVVRQAVLDGDLRARSNARLAGAIWHCNRLSGRGQREACLAQLVPVPRDNAGLWALHRAAHPEGSVQQQTDPARVVP
jgi:hypothetical protein